MSAVIECFNSFSKAVFKPSTAWWFVFVPAVAYYVSHHLSSLGLFRSSTYGDVIPQQHAIQWLMKKQPLDFCKEKRRWKDFLFLSNDCQYLQYPPYLVLEDDTESIVATTWMEDQELGRGYLLISSSTQKGKIYQWETGGGPIAIGRTLHLQDAGCRSNLYRNCSIASSTSRNNHLAVGSGGIAVDTFSNPESPRLLVAEYGEGRIVRLEENGARTPLIILVNRTYPFADKDDDDDKSTHYSSRLCEPFRLVVTPQKELLVMERTTACRSDDSNSIHSQSHDYLLWRLPQVSKIPGLSSLAMSRQAHSWTDVYHGISGGNDPKQEQRQQELPHCVFYAPVMGGMVVDSTGQRLLVTTKTMDESQFKTAVVVSLSLNDHQDDEDTPTMYKSAAPISSNVWLDFSDHASQPGAIAIDNNGNVFLAIDDGILMVSSSHDLMAKLDLSYVIRTDHPIVDLTVGSDKFLYMATKSQLVRFRIPGTPLLIDKKTLWKPLNDDA